MKRTTWIYAAVAIAVLGGCGHPDQQTQKVDNVTETKKESVKFPVHTTNDVSYNEQAKITFPENFQSWDFPAQKVVGGERTFYADGHLVNMPNTIGEWEALLGVHFAEVPSSYRSGIPNYKYNTVCVIDENDVPYMFKIDTESYVKQEDPEKEWEQLKGTETIGFEMDYIEGHWSQDNMSMRDYISLLPDKNLFTDDVETVSIQLADIYGAELEADVEGYHFYADEYDKGFTVEWNCTKDGKRRKLDVEYVPDAYLAYCKFLKGEIMAYFFGDENAEYGLTLEDVMGDGLTEEIQMLLWDVSDDGIPEMVLRSLNGIHVVYYQSNTGTLRTESFNSSNEDVTAYGVLIENGYLFEDGSFDHYYPDDAIYTEAYYYIIGENGPEELAVIQECKEHKDKFINHKIATDEEVRECKKMYGTPINIGESRTLEETIENVKKESELVYAAIGIHGKSPRIEKYDDTKLTEITLDENKMKRVKLLLNIKNGNERITGDGETNYFDLPLAFSQQDINNDGRLEIVVGYSSEDGRMWEPEIYMENAEGYFENVGYVSDYLPETGGEFYGEILTTENIEKALGVIICADGYVIRDANL